MIDGKGIAQNSPQQYCARDAFCPQLLEGRQIAFWQTHVLLQLLRHQVIQQPNHQKILSCWQDNQE